MRSKAYYHKIKVGILDSTCFKENVLTFEILVGYIFNPNTFAGLVGKVRKKLSRRRKEGRVEEKVGKVRKNYLPKEEGREGGGKKRPQRIRGGRGSNPGPAAC